MAYATYTTEAIVCGSKLHNTADRAYLLFTRELGMLWATARSVREERSRQRYGLQDFSIIRVSLIKGKSGWRVGSTEALGNPFMAATTRPARSGVAYLIKQLRRFVQGEQTMEAVFDDVYAALEAVAVAETVAEVTRWQDVVLVRLLHVLGYVSVTPQLRDILAAPAVAVAVVGYDDTLTPAVSTAIAKAHEVSHL